MPFVGKEAKLNRLIFTLLDAKKILTTYETYQLLRHIKGCRSIKHWVVDRRIKILHQENWLVQVGTKKNQPDLVDSEVYALSNRGKTSLVSDKVSRNRFLMEADDELLEKMRKLLLEFLDSNGKRPRRVS